MNDQSKENDFIPSIFSKVRTKPGKYPDNLCFKKSSLESLQSITYPESFDLISQESFPEKSKIDAARKTCKDDRASDENYPYLLVSGDFSGIQDTVYTISSQGALKSLRARSFMLELLCEHICCELITACVGEYKKQESRDHVVFSGGGSFCLLLPASKENIDYVNNFKKFINDWAFAEFSGKFYVALSFSMLNDDDLDKEHFKSKWEDLKEQLDDDKKNKFKWKLEDIFKENFSKEPEQKTYKEECQICHRDDIDLSLKNHRFYNLETFNSIETPQKLTAQSENYNVAHSLCYQLFRLGNKLTKIAYIYRTYKYPNPNVNSNKDGFICFPDRDNEPVYYLVLSEKEKEEREKQEKEKTSEEIEWFWKINVPENNENNYIPFLYADYVRKVSDLPQGAQEKEKEVYREEHPKRAELTEEKMKTTTASFTGHAYASCGADLIGCLRMDVDNLGKIFSEHLEDFDLVSLSHLSKMLNVFFKVYLNKICEGNLGGNLRAIDFTKKGYIDEPSGELEKAEYRRVRGEKGRNVSVVYAGGDDLFIVGAWDEVVELSYDIQSCFAKFSGLGISGGLTLHKSKYPLYQMAKLSGEAEKEAKTFTEVKGDKASKNKFALFYSPSTKYKSKALNYQAEKDLKQGIDNYRNKLIYALKWDDRTPIEMVTTLVDFCKKKDNRLELKYLSRGFLYRLFNLADLWWESKTLYVPDLFYIMKRMQIGLDVKLMKQFDFLKDQIVKMPLSKNSGHQTIRYIKFPLTWIELLQRSKGE